MAIEFDVKKIKVVKIDEVRPNSWNPKSKDISKEEYQEIKKSIELNGLQAPIYVRENEGYEIVDGEQRYTVCKELGYENIVIYNFGNITESEAISLTLGFQTQRPFEHLELAKLISEKLKEFPDIKLPYLETKINELLEITEFDFDKNEEDRELKDGEVSLFEKVEDMFSKLSNEQRVLIISEYNPETGESYGRAN